MSTREGENICIQHSSLPILSNSDNVTTVTTVSLTKICVEVLWYALVLQKKSSFWKFCLELTGFLKLKPLYPHPPNHSLHSRSFNFALDKKCMLVARYSNIFQGIAEPVERSFDTEEKKINFIFTLTSKCCYVNTNNNIFSSCHLKPCDIITRRFVILYFKMGLHFVLLQNPVAFGTQSLVQQ